MAQRPGFDGTWRWADPGLPRSSAKGKNFGGMFWRGLGWFWGSKSNTRVRQFRNSAADPGRSHEDPRAGNSGGLPAASPWRRTIEASRSARSCSVGSLEVRGFAG
ncbi:unnamed protein product [Symbiodinium natans]|uniref:Uncharacterized protein n=1 Tax=Symbiodinium natans TaxID=878477 RepID=A0A812M469_9DINO|nr:unnamed protein product [Symbiodinium natans]